MNLVIAQVLGLSYMTKYDLIPKSTGYFKGTPNIICSRSRQHSLIPFISRFHSTMKHKSFFVTKKIKNESREQSG